MPFVVLFTAAVIVFFAFIMYTSGKNSEIIAHGIQTCATVSQVVRSHTGTLRTVTVKYTDEMGAVHENMLVHNETDLAVGDKVIIKYLPGYDRYVLSVGRENL